MNRKIFLAIAISLLLPVQGFPEVSGSVSAGGRSVNVLPDSSKFNEYRDLRDGFYLYRFGVTSDSAAPFLFEINGSNAGRNDQEYGLRTGVPGRFTVELKWDQLDHRLSNRARTPYSNQGDGLLTVAAPAPIATKNLATASAANDALTEAYLRAYLQPVELGNDRKKFTAAFRLFPVDGLKFRMSASNEDRIGNKVGYGPIGDRPPRTLNVQLIEPIEYRTREVTFDAEYAGKRSQANFSYLLSNFWNHIDAVTWQNLYTNPAAGTSEVWADGRPVATFGRRTLPQDNTFQNFSLTYGVDLPMASRLTIAASYGIAEQNSLLQPYSTNGTADPVSGVAWDQASKLPRARAEAAIQTKLFSLDYVVNPIQALNLRAFGRYYGLSNKTPTSDWRYVTSDVTSALGAVTYLNRRRNLPYQYGKQNYGLEGNYSVPFWRSTLGLGFEHERVDREFREANTAENIVRASARSRPTKWLSVRTKYQYGNRQASHYEGEAGRGSYSYAPGEANDDVDSQFSFENHPDTRRWDVTDRKRHQVDMQVAASPLESLDVSLSGRYRNDNYDSGVGPSQPLLNYAGGRATITAADRAAATPGDQVGLLSDKRHSVGLDMSYAATKRVRFNLFASREQADSSQRGFEFQENNKVTPTAVAAGTELGPWTRKTMQWMADIQDTTYSYGAGAAVEIVPEKLAFNTNYTHSIGRVAIGYDGWGTVSSINPANGLADNNQFGFRTPPILRNDRYVISSSLDYSILKDLSISLGYLFDYFRQRDWQQEPTPQTEAVSGNENFNRDSSQSTHWGNRLPNLGAYLAPSYEAHLVSLSMNYRF